MKLIKPSFEILEQLPGLEGVYKQIELAGRTCYRSTDKITEDSAKEFVDRMIKSGHGAMLEHGTVYLYYTNRSTVQKDTIFPHWKYERNKYSKCNTISMQGTDCFGNPAPVEFYITTNLRVLVENNWLDDLQYICEPTEFHEKRHTVKFTCDRGVSHEFVRHRVFSFAQESTRYCNYSKDKFGNEITFIIPCWMDIEEGSYSNYSILEGPERWDLVEEGEEYYEWIINGVVLYPNKISHNWLKGVFESEQTYLNLINNEWKAQEARSVLPNSLKTELVMTGFESDWKHFFELRCPGSAHPQARELAIPLQEKFKELKWVD